MNFKKLSSFIQGAFFILLALFAICGLFISFAGFMVLLLEWVDPFGKDSLWRLLMLLGGSIIAVTLLRYMFNKFSEKEEAEKLANNENKTVE